MCGNVCVMAPPRIPPMERFWAKVDKNGPIPVLRPKLGSCWLWTGGHDWYGYGRFRPGGTAGSVGAHRFAYLNLVGPIGPGLEVDHLCFIRHCVNPAHLEAVTPRVNTLRRLPFTSHQTRKTHCPKKHPYSGRNLVIDYLGRRRCRICRDASASRYYQSTKGVR